MTRVREILLPWNTWRIPCDYLEREPEISRRTLCVYNHFVKPDEDGRSSIKSVYNVADHAANAMRACRIPKLFAENYVFGENTPGAL